MRKQLGGRVELCWKAAGLVCTIEVPLGRVAAGTPTATHAGAVFARAETAE
jgi:hypothetical protein